MIVKLLNGHHLQFLSLLIGVTGSYESTLVKMPQVENHMPRLNYFVIFANFRLVVRSVTLALNWLFTRI